LLSCLFLFSIFCGKKKIAKSLDHLTGAQYVEKLDEEKSKWFWPRTFGQQGSKVAKTMVSNELEPNRKQFPDHLPFILHGCAGGVLLVH
jgi:hypothetical protein